MSFCHFIVSLSNPFSERVKESMNGFIDPESPNFDLNHAKYYAEIISFLSKKGGYFGYLPFTAVL